MLHFYMTQAVPSNDDVNYVLVSAPGKKRKEKKTTINKKE